MSYQSIVEADSPHDYWRLNETTGASAADTMGNLPGWWDFDATIGVPGVPGIGDTAVSLSGTGSSNDLFYAPTSAGSPGTAIAAPAAPLTEEIWVKISTATGGVVMQFNNAYQFGGTSYDRCLLIDTTGKVQWLVFTTVTVAIISAVAVNNGNWHHLAGVVQSNNNMQLYVDGSISNGGANTNSGTPASYTGYWRIGAGNKAFAGITNAPTQDQLIGGVVSSAAVYPTALSASQILAHYNAGVGSSTSAFPHVDVAIGA